MAVLGQLGDDQLVDLVGVDEQLVDRAARRRTSGRRMTMPSSLHISSTSTPHRSPSRCWRAMAHGRVHLGAEGREDADPPVADLVPEALDDDRAVVGHRAGGLGLLVEVGDEVGRRPRSSRPWRAAAARVDAASLGAVADLPGEGADGPAQLERAARAVAVPERHLPGLARAPG